MADLARREARRFLRELKLTSGEYYQYALAARKKYVDLRLRQDSQIRAIYIRAADRVAKRILNLSRTTGVNQMTLRYLAELEESLREEGDRISQTLMDYVTKYVTEAAKAGSSFSYQVTLSQLEGTRLAKEPIHRIFARANTQAVEAIWARTHKGLTLSDRIWQKGRNANRVMVEIIQDAVAMGEDPVETARKLQRYVRKGKGTLAQDYPEMMARMGSRIPNDLSYEALRLVRTETAAAYGEGTIAAARVSPSYTGMKWLLSNNSTPCDVCKSLAEKNVGLGQGVYPPGEEPPMPAHPNCMCALVPHYEDPESFTKRLIEWVNNPSAHPDLEEWYQNVYRRGVVA